MATAVRNRGLGVLAVAGALAFAGAPAIAVGAPSVAPAPYTCAGGEIPSGTYTRLTVTGECSIAADAVVHVLGNVQVARGASLDAQSVPSTLTVGGNVTGTSVGFVGLGCQPPAATGNSAHPCVEPYEDDQSDITVHGNVTVTSAAAVMLNGIEVHGNVTLTGGGSTIPWSIKNNTIDGNLTITGQRTEWLGVLFNSVGKNVTLTNIALSDPHPGAPGVYIVRNNVEGNLTCTKLTPGVSGGFVPGSVNVVGGNATGQCADLV
ncbi:hypothetical protein [Tessaracoccus sp. G1721]